MLGIAVLNEAVSLVKRRIPIATVIRVLEIDTQMNYRTAYNIIKADVNGLKGSTRPMWLTDTPDIQESPDNWVLRRAFTEKGRWEYVGGQ